MSPPGLDDSYADGRNSRRVAGIYSWSIPALIAISRKRGVVSEQPKGRAG